MMKLTGAGTHVVRVGQDGSINGVHIVLRLQTDNGLEGVSYITRLHDAAPAALNVLQLYVDRIVGMDPLAPEAILDRLLLRGRPLPWFEARAASAIDVALWDIRGKAAGQPVHKLMGGYRNRVPCYASWRVEPDQDLDKVARSAQRHVENGFRAMKCHLGPATLSGAVEHMRVLREAVGEAIDRDEAQMFADEADEASRPRLLAGVQYPSDIAAGQDLGRRVAAVVIDRAKHDGSDARWTGTVPTEPGRWNGTNPILTLAGTWKTWHSPRAVSCGPAPAYYSPEEAADMAVVNNFQRTPKTTPAPNHPNYSVAHGCLSSASAGALSYLFPRDAETLNALAVEAAPIAHRGGAHFPIDIRVGLALGRSVAQRSSTWSRPTN